MVSVIAAGEEVQDVAGLFWGFGSFLQGARSAEVAVGGVDARRGGGREPAGSYVEAPDCSLEDLVGCFGLVGWGLVAGLVDACKGVVAMLTDLAANVGAVDLDVGVAGVVEGLGLTVFYS